VRKHISFAIAATIVGLAKFFWISAAAVETNADFVSQKLATPYLPAQVLVPAY